MGVDFEAELPLRAKLYGSRGSIGPCGKEECGGIFRYSGGACFTSRLPATPGITGVRVFPMIQFGPSNTVGIHSYNETVEIEDVVTAAKAYVAAVCDLMGIE